VWTGISIQATYISVKRYLPKNLARTTERLMPKERLTKEQFSKIELLAKNVGLQKADIISAVDNPVLEAGIPARPRFLVWLNIMIVVVAVITIAVLIWALANSDNPIPTYAPGTYYGTIKPQDFAMM
jgi:hypothetical protein